jgi:hypothetical protein
VKGEGESEGEGCCSVRQERMTSRASPFAGGACRRSLSVSVVGAGKWRVAGDGWEGKARKGFQIARLGTQDFLAAGMDGLAPLISHSSISTALRNRGCSRQEYFTGILYSGPGWGIGAHLH